MPQAPSNEAAARFLIHASPAPSLAPAVSSRVSHSAHQTGSVHSAEADSTEAEAPYLRPQTSAGLPASTASALSISAHPLPSAISELSAAGAAAPGFAAERTLGAARFLSFPPASRRKGKRECVERRFSTVSLARACVCGRLGRGKRVERYAFSRQPVHCFLSHFLSSSHSQWRREEALEERWGDVWSATDARQKRLIRRRRRLR